jgi:mRNA interferase MazF
VTPQRGDVWWVNLDPTQGSEIHKTRPCLIVTSNVLNRHRRTVVVIPFSTAADAHPPITVPVVCQGMEAVAVVDQIRSIAKHRLVSRIEVASADTLQAVTAALARILEMA